MADKTFLQELYSIKTELELLNSVYTKNHEKYDMDTLDRFSKVIHSVQEMINKRIEIQLEMKKHEKSSSSYKL